MSSLINILVIAQAGDEKNELLDPWIEKLTETTAPCGELKYLTKH